MTTDISHARGFLTRLLSEHDQAELLKRLEPHPDNVPEKVVTGAHITPEVVAERWAAIPVAPESREELLDPRTRDRMELYQRNIENFIGTVKLPVGVAGPLRVNGLFATGDYIIPLATTEAALVASYNRGAQLISRVGGCTAMLLNEGVSRAPGFAFATMAEAGQFVAWAVAEVEAFRATAEATTHHGRLSDMRVAVEGNHVYLIFEFLTGDASGQNMATIATDAICGYIRTHSPIKPSYHFVEANLSGDKKASAQSFLGVRGKKVTAEVIVPGELVKKHLHTTPERMVDYWRMSALGGVLSGTIGVQGHFANGLAALYIACGQDAACVAESAVGVTRMEVTAEGSLYATVTLPNLMVGTIGGGTGLPSQRACLDILGLAGPDKARALAEVCAGLSLAGELSIIGALASGEFTRAHRRLARGKAGEHGTTGGETK
ncbi:MAG: hydroxymethylglutaryl-CoA reductase [Geobacter sp.]|nr:hydroxymethylglutaryl-CoA reductase [Geobacter sp.]